MAESLANQYRPLRFEDVVGQENIVKILTNQIVTKQIKHGYLLTGGAGTGKTTVARIFARNINRKVIVEALIEDSDVEPFEDMYPALQLSEQQGEIIEIDAASNNGVDNVRELRENCKFKPINGGYKVYIIDEVHMLSPGAFNALLKTLEEPPEHCIFILCTTDPQKIPATILSRVQRFQFSRMSVQQIEDRLNHIVIVEGLNVEIDVTEYIAKLANGGMRDAISLLDTCLAYRTEERSVLQLQDVVSVLGSSNYDQYLRLMWYIIEHDREGVIMTIEAIHQDGKDLKQFIKGFMEFVLDIEKYNIASMDYVSAPSIYKEELDRLIRYDLFDKWFERLMKLNEWIKYDPNPKVLIEGCLLVLCER